MDFFPFEMAPMSSVEAMQNCFRHADPNLPQFMAMSIPMMAHAQAQAHSNCYRQQPYRQQAGASNGHYDNDVFHVELDVQQYSPEEISVKVVRDQVVIEGKHEAREVGRISAARHFVHHYSVPAGVKSEDITSSMSSDGILTVSATKAQSKNETKEQVIPITPTGLPAKKPDAGEPSSSKSSGESKKE